MSGSKTGSTWHLPQLRAVGGCQECGRFPEFDGDGMPRLEDPAVGIFWMAFS